MRDSEDEEKQHQYSEINKVFEQTKTKIVTNHSKIVSNKKNNQDWSASKPQENKVHTKKISNIVSREIEYMLEESKLMNDPEVQVLKDSNDSLLKDESNVHACTSPPKPPGGFNRREQSKDNH